MFVLLVIKILPSFSFDACITFFAPIVISIFCGELISSPYNVKVGTGFKQKKKIKSDNCSTFYI